MVLRHRNWKHPVVAKLLSQYGLPEHVPQAELTKNKVSLILGCDDRFFLHPGSVMVESTKKPEDTEPALTVTSASEVFWPTKP